MISGIVALDAQNLQPERLTSLIGAVEAEALTGPPNCYETKSALLASANLAPGGGAIDAAANVITDDAVLLADCRLDKAGEIAGALGLSADADTSSILAAAWKRWGPDMAAHLHGDFAIAVWQSTERRLTLMRDIMGVRPLFHTIPKDGKVGVCSLPGPLVRTRLASGRPDHDTLDRFARMDLRTGAATGLADVKRVRPGHVVQIAADGVRETRYWALTCRDPIPDGADFEAIAETLRDKIRVAVARRLTAGDGPVAAHVSGGLDSSLVAVMAAQSAPGRKIHGFAIRPPHRPGDPATVDATPFVNAVVQSEPGLDASFVDNLPADAYATVPLADHMPIAMSEQVPFVAIASQAAERGAGIILTGLGGDQLVSHNGRGALTEWLLTGRWRRLLSEARAIGSPLGRHPIDVLGGDVLRRLVPHDWSARIAGWLGRTRQHANTARRPFLRGRPRMVDIGQTGITTRAQRLSLAGTDGSTPLSVEALALSAARHGMTCAHPLLDRDVMEFAIRLPASFLLRDGSSRAIMRAVADGLLPDSVRLGTKGRLDDATMVLRAAEGRAEFLDAIDDIRASRMQTSVDLDALERAVRDLPDPGERRAQMERAARTGGQTGETELAYLFPFLLARFAARQAEDR